MQFNSVTYLLLFLPVAVLTYWWAPERGRLWVIFVASLIFYGFWRIAFVPLMLLTAGADYFLARLIEASTGERRRRLLLTISVCVSLTILIVFKYLGFLATSAWSFGHLLGFKMDKPELQIILPLGISFYIFATISYVVDVYRRIIPAERSMLVYFCFVTFFPHLVAGPILRAGVLIPQLANRPPFLAIDIPQAIKQIIQGLFLKVVLADNLAIFVNAAFDPGKYNQLHAADGWTMAFLFGFQIYFDFAGYSLIAIGSARLMGIYLPDNFNFPYVATSPRDFWKRWHISLSTWVRDYLYLPLMSDRPAGKGWEAIPMSRGTTGLEHRRTGALFVTWGCMGLWHGANWTFLVWGVYHAACIWGQRLLAVRLPNVLRAAIGWCITLPLMMAAWIPFRTQSVKDALTLWSKMVDPRGFSNLGLWADCYFAAASTTAGFFAWWLVRRSYSRLHTRTFALLLVEGASWAIALFFIFVFLKIRQQFIYFQF